MYLFSDKNAPPDDLGNFVVSFWRENEDEPRDVMRARVASALASGNILSLLQALPSSRLPSIIPIELRNNGLTASVRTSPPDSHYLQQLEPISKFVSKFVATASPPLMRPLHTLDSIRFVSAFESGSAGAYLVKPQNDAHPHVLKVLLETDFLLHTDEEISFTFTARLTAMYNEMRILMKIPPHPNIIQPPIALVTMLRAGEPVVCGFLAKFHPGGNIRDLLDAADPPSLERRVRWASQIAAAIHHLHRVAHTYHGDIKLDNVVLSANDDAVLIDFEQTRHAEACLAPEAHGEWDVIPDVPVERDVGTNAITVRYVQYNGPDRGDDWSAYGAWEGYPDAIEAIEVYALGDLLKTLFDSTSPPGTISKISDQCLNADPIARPRLETIAAELRALSEQS